MGSAIKSFARRVPPAAAVVALSGLCALSAAGDSASARASVAACSGSALRATMNVIQGSAGAGNIGYTLALRNPGPHPCRLGNHPKLKLLDASGKGLPTHVARLGRSNTITINPGHTAKARLRFSPDITGPGEPAHGPCQPVAHLLRITITAPGGGSQTARVKPATSVCGHGAIQEQPLS